MLLYMMIYFFKKPKKKKKKTPRSIIINELFVVIKLLIIIYCSSSLTLQCFIILRHFVQHSFCNIVIVFVVNHDLPGTYTQFWLA